MAKSAVGVVARIVAKPESVEIVREGLTSLLEPTRAEAGCILYELMQNRSDPTDFTFYEEWTDEASLNAHGATVHLHPGDTVVQNGTRHRWSNPGEVPVVIAVFLIGAHHDRVTVT